ncbi:MAG: hypothetical protein COA97_06540 [Flavobacteriales bacterium]|nr:MAG: hypothetical protein COA97_06540 [Flavobacteriales bacterium]
MKNTRFLALTLTIFAFLIMPELFSQKSTYEIVQNNNVSNLSEYNIAMDKANFDSYRYINKRRKITFNTGVEIELLSVYELQKLNIPVDASKGRIYNKKNETTPIYRLGKNGYILAEIETKNTLKGK